jgi:hypothetical protein
MGKIRGGHIYIQTARCLAKRDDTHRQQSDLVSLKNYGEYTDRWTDADRKQGDLISVIFFLSAYFPYFQQN